MVISESAAERVRPSRKHLWGRQKVVEGFRSHQWNLIVLLAHDEPVLDLASANPLRAYAVAAWRVAVKTS